MLPIPQQGRYRSRDWFQNLITLPNSATLKRIRNPVRFPNPDASRRRVLSPSLALGSRLPVRGARRLRRRPAAAARARRARSPRAQVVAMTLWSAVVCALHAHPRVPLAPMPALPHSLLGSALSLLLVFRTNSACVGPARQSPSHSP